MTLNYRFGWQVLVAIGIGFWALPQDPRPTPETIFNIFCVAEVVFWAGLWAYTFQLKRKPKKRKRRKPEPPPAQYDPDRPTTF